jgi:hypothetical protein
LAAPLAARTAPRGTSTFDGCALAYGVLDHLTTPGRAPRLLFATHYHRLTLEPDLRARVQLGHMASELVVDEGGGGGGVAGPGGQEAHGPGRLSLRNTFELRPGAAPNGSCGIDVAAVAGLPGHVVARARAVAAVMERVEAPESGGSEGLSAGGAREQEAACGRGGGGRAWEQQAACGGWVAGELERAAAAPAAGGVDGGAYGRQQVGQEPAWGGQGAQALAGASGATGHAALEDEEFDDGDW